MALDPHGLWTVDRALRELPPRAHWEIDEGRLVMREPAGPYHGVATTLVTVRLHAFVSSHSLGRVLSGEPGFYLARIPDTLRAPDVAFVSTLRWQAITDPERFAEIPPNLAVEVLSPSERPAAVRRKVAQYLALGVGSVWLIDPRRRTLEQCLATGEVRVYGGEGDVVTDPTLPGFQCTFGELLPPPIAGRTPTTPS